MDSGKIKNFNNLHITLSPLISTGQLWPHIVAPQGFAGISAPNISTISIQKFPPWKRIFSRRLVDTFAWKCLEISPKPAPVLTIPGNVFLERPGTAPFAIRQPSTR